MPESAVVHPLVLLSVVDHYNRVARDTRKRVVGILLGEQSKGVVQVTNSFAGEPLLGSRAAVSQLPGRPIRECHTAEGSVPAGHGVRIPLSICTDHIQLRLCVLDPHIAVGYAVPFEEDDRDPSIWFLDHSYVDNMATMFKKVNGEHVLALQSRRAASSATEQGFRS